MRPPVFTGEDRVKVPEPLTEQPPADRYCDLVLTGGVASGVVYPWAILELARCFRFRNIGGTSVGAMAATLAAAAEYGRRNGKDRGFEVLRLLPGALAEELPDGRTRMLSLFQPSPQGRRLFGLFVALVRKFGEPAGGERATVRELLWSVARAYAAEALVGACLGGSVAAVLGGQESKIALLISAVLGAVVSVLYAIRSEVRDGIIRNDMGLCRGSTVTDGNTASVADKEIEEPGIVQWLHKGIQQAAGLELDDQPLTFRDLWCAPTFPGAAVQAREPQAKMDRSINLQLITTNVTHGRPYRLPFEDETSRLYFCPKELAPFFPAKVMEALLNASIPYAPRSDSDPPVEVGAGLLEMPGGGMPIVVAARLSLSFPILFSAVPLYAIDYEMQKGSRLLKRCWFSDGGICSNFPIHLFDAAIPRWPTFGMWLGKRSPFRKLPVWLPDKREQGRGDSWQRFDIDDSGTPRYTGEGTPTPFGMFGGFLLALGVSAKDWQDRSVMRMPHVRNRVARLALKPGEGELNIAMSRANILSMAHTYGTGAGKRLVRRFASPVGARPSRAWTQHRMVRVQTLLHGLRGLLRGVAAAAEGSAHTVPVRATIEAAATANRTDRLPRTEQLTAAQSEALLATLDAVCRLEAAFEAETRPLGERLRPEPELRTQPPL